MLCVAPRSVWRARLGGSVSMQTMNVRRADQSAVVQSGKTNYWDATSDWESVRGKTSYVAWMLAFFSDAVPSRRWVSGGCGEHVNRTKRQPLDPMAATKIDLHMGPAATAFAVDNDANPEFGMEHALPNVKAMLCLC